MFKLNIKRINIRYQSIFFTRIYKIQIKSSINSQICINQGHTYQGITDSKQSRP